jgi:hypothetical protein
VATRFCVAGGGEFLVGARGDRIDFVATTSRGHRSGDLGPGRHARPAASRGPARIAPGVLLGPRSRNGRLIYRVRGRRIRFVAVLAHRQVSHRTSLVRRLQAAGLLR